MAVPRTTQSLHRLGKRPRGPGSLLRHGDGTAAAWFRASLATAWALWTLVPAGCRDSDKAVSSSTEAGTKSPIAVERLRDELPEGPFRWTRVRGHGVTFRHESGNSPVRPFPAANGSGIAAVDFDRDGWIDLYFASGHALPPDGDRPPQPDRMFRQVGAWSFEDVTGAAGLGSLDYSAGLAVGDYDSDGFFDLYVCAYGRNLLYHNLGDGTFEEVAQAAGVDDPGWGTSAAFLDYDADGLLDLYVANYALWDLESNAFCGDRDRDIRIFCSPTSVPPAPDRLYRNRGDGTFEDVTAESGIDRLTTRTQGLITADVDRDGDTDIYLGNDLHANALFLNDGNGRFEEVAEMAGVAYDLQGRAQAGMGVAVGDLDRDGEFDLFVTNYENEHNVLYRSTSSARYHDASFERGVAAAGRPWIGWGTALVDFDLDGWSDILVVNGHTDDNLHLLGRETPYRQPPLIWQNREGRFRVVRPDCDYFLQAVPARALAVADVDNDGDTDAVAGHQDAGPALLRNESRDTPLLQAVQLTLIGRQSNRDAVGAIVERTHSERPFILSVTGGGSYLSAHDLRLTVPAESDGSCDLRIRWPSGRVDEGIDLQCGRAYFIIEPIGSGEAARIVEVP